MGVNPTRFAIVVAASLACLMLGLFLGVSAGTRQGANISQVRTVTTTAAPNPVANRTVTLTQTVTVPTTVTVGTTVTAAPVPGPATVHHSHPGQPPPAKPGHGPGHQAPPPPPKHRGGHPKKPKKPKKPRHTPKHHGKHHHGKHGAPPPVVNSR